jgi:hypothetical protein
LTRNLREILDILLTYAAGLTEELNSVRLANAGPREPLLGSEPSDQELPKVSSEVARKARRVHPLCEYLRNQFKRVAYLTGQYGL